MDWPEIGCFREISTIADTAFLLGGGHVDKCLSLSRCLYILHILQNANRHTLEANIDRRSIQFILAKRRWPCNWSGLEFLVQTRQGYDVGNQTNTENMQSPEKKKEKFWKSYKFIYFGSYLEMRCVVSKHVLSALQCYLTCNHIVSFRAKILPLGHEWNMPNLDSTTPDPPFSQINTASQMII